ncbi:MAG: Peptidase, M23 family [Candidatus Gottesmanbacteria bacterium GW2011_GWA1_42_26]|nr:MAG: Peptidase, M23 family [Candidatus Gottesmanbacteria bacterium GW2011_GWA1_42_26]OGG10536.1 MAG: hypothetical protein A2699_01970 [Candidatus Gottesmanbacteria bacterium RIFCSPHIGHO2_01_FULL_43_15]OGG25205.1 MAG: hypothetical protein A3A59_00820 [Candidatus Gottesmanbacteria bacterium RIFCSPLOWO2_01_FULL_42_10]HCM37546.1 hypothetical protein [Patescibacteria group bacterium]
MKKLLTGILLVILFVMAVTPAAGDQIQDLQKQIDDLTQKLSQTQAQAQTLSAEITAMDQRIKLTTLQISNSVEKINQLEIEIRELNKKIEGLDVTLSHLSQVLINRIVSAYKVKRVSYLTLLFSANGLTDFVSRAKYIQIAQTHDRRVLTEVQVAKADVSDKKAQRELKKAEQEKLKQQLEQQKTILANQKQSKQALLEVTKNDEATYQELLASARAELAVALGQGQEVFLRNVNEGDKIGSLIGGASGCSSGTHLHFEVHEGTSIKDPNDYLKSVSFSYSYPSSQYGYYGTINPRGSWSWPMSEPIQINQGYGSHDFARTFYPGGVHYGIDMDSADNSVKAVKSGKLYAGSFQCGGTYAGTLYYAKVDQGDGITSWYLHMIPQ